LQKKSKQDEGYKLDMNMSMPRKEAEITKKAILPELNARHVKRSKTSINIKNTTMSINITSQDKSALRAAANSCLNQITLAKSILEVEKWQNQNKQK